MDEAACSSLAIFLHTMQSLAELRFSWMWCIFALVAINIIVDKKQRFKLVSACCWGASTSRVVAVNSEGVCQRGGMGFDKKNWLFFFRRSRCS